MDKKAPWRRELETILRLAARQPKIFSLFLDDLLSPDELAELPLRWQIIKRLQQKQPQHQIAKDLGVGVATVTRGARVLKNKNGGFCRILKIIK